MFYIAYLGVTGSGCCASDCGARWPKPDHGPYFSLGRWGMLVNVVAVVYGAIVAVNIAWPRAAVYDALAGTKDANGNVIPSHWYWQYIAILFIGIVTRSARRTTSPCTAASRSRCSGNTRLRCRNCPARAWRLARRPRDRRLTQVASDSGGSGGDRPLPARAPAVRRARRRGRRTGRRAAELEPLPAGTTIFAEGGEPVEHLRVIRSGAVEIVSDGACCDLLGEGELFGHASMLSGLPAGFRPARPRTRLLPDRRRGGQALLAGPEGLRFVARSLLEAPTELHTLAREPAATSPTSRWRRWSAASRSCAGPDTSIREAAQLMSAGAGHLGRRRSGRRAGSGSSPIATCARASWPAGCPATRRCRRRCRRPPTRARRTGRPARCCSRCSTAACATSRSISPTGRSLGVVEDMDLVAVRTRSSFYLRQRIADRPQRRPSW